MIVRGARPEEREALEQLQWRASLHSGTYREQLLAHPDAIELPADQIADGHVRVADDDGALAGFAVLFAADDGACELDGLFVEPDRWRHGVGRLLIEDAAQLARRRGAERIDVIANPDALVFYGRVGFTDAGEAPTRFGSARRMSLAVA